MRDLEGVKIAVIGLGYVGLPLAIEFGHKYSTLGFDINETRVAELCEGVDTTLEVEADDFQRADRLSFTIDESRLADCNVYIVTVPTPIDQHRRPNLTPLTSASSLLGRYLSQGDIVIYESTVYPGCTEEVCIPILEETSGLKFNKDFFAGYSPERINPGDKTHRLPDIKKVTSGSTQEAADFIDQLYQSIIRAGTHKASSIKVAEAAKVIENTQRDLNIALVNELSLIFNRLGIDTSEVLEAAATKWNFLPFKPGLVGGHCIGVDPYYLTHKAQEIGYHPEVILAGRRINDGMGRFIADEVAKLVILRGGVVKNARALVLGLTFKEDCPDLRNTRVTDIITGLSSYGMQVDVYDPWVEPAVAQEELSVSLVDTPDEHAYDAIILAVAHKEFRALTMDELGKWGNGNTTIYDVKSILPKTEVDARL